MLICGLDFETSGRDPGRHSVVEVGAVLWCTELRRPVRSMGYLVYDHDAVWEEGATECNGITQDQCRDYGIEESQSLEQLISYYCMADAVATHNGNIFDRLFYESWCERLLRYEYKDQGKPWIDTKIDLGFPDKWSSRLKYLAAEHGILHAHAHGALPDATVMLEILDRYDLDKVMESALSPTVIVQAVVSYDDRERAKARGYYWRPAEKRWVKGIKASKVEDEARVVGFPIKVIKD